MFKKVLMVCVGNICRSPMAEALWKAKLGARGVEVSSAGLSALVGHGADPEVISLMQARGLDVSAHRARQLTREQVLGAELILVMSEEQRRELEAQVPEARGRVHRVGKFGGFDVPDPYRRPRAIFEEALGLIERGLTDFERAFYA